MRTLQGWSSWGGEEARWEWERLSQMDESESFYIRCSSVNSFFRPNTYSASTYVYQNKCKWYSTHNLLSCARSRVSKRVMEVLLFIPSYSTYLTVWKSSDWKLWGHVLIINTLYIYLTPPRDLSLLNPITSNPRFYIHWGGMVHRVGSQAFNEPVFCALSSCGFFCVCSFNLSFCFLKVQKFISAEKWVPTGIVAKKWDPGILDPGPFSGQIRKVEARLGKFAKIRKVETD